MRSPLGIVVLALRAAGYLIFDAPRWQRLGVIAIPLFGIIGLAVGELATATLHTDGTWAGVLVGSVGWASTLRWLYNRFPPTPEQAAIAYESIRRSTLELGCLATIGWFGGALVAGAAIESLIGLRFGGVAVLASLAVAVAGSIWTFRALRRRYPPPPQTKVERWMARAFGFGLLSVVVLGAWLLLSSSPSVTDEQTAWCLEAGSGYLDNAVRVLSIPRTWNAENARTDRQFAEACSTAWDATH